MTYRQKTISILVLIGLVLIGWDFFVAFGNEESGDTISAVIHEFGSNSWFVLVGIGVLLGHFFWPLRDGQNDSND